MIIFLLKSEYVYDEDNFSMQYARFPRVVSMF